MYISSEATSSGKQPWSTSPASAAKKVTYCGIGEAGLAGDRLQHLAHAGDLLREAVQQEAARSPGVLHTETDQRHVLRGEGVAGGEELSHVAGGASGSSPAAVKASLL